MADITTIGTEELQSDLGKCRHDIMVCELAIENHVFASFSEAELTKRLDDNRLIVGMITAELERRGERHD